MRTRLTRNQRRADILEKAGKLFQSKGYTATEMEDIRLECSISRGGLYHHFQNKRTVLDAIIESEVDELAQEIESSDASPLPMLLRVGSGHLGAATGVLSSLESKEERLDYLSGLDQAFANRLSPVLCDRLTNFVHPGTDAGHVAELFLTVNAHINRRVLLEHWREAEAAGFAATALEALAPLLREPDDLSPIINDLKNEASVT